MGMPSTRLTSGETDSLQPRRPTLELSLLRRELMLITRELLLPMLRPEPTESPPRRNSTSPELPISSPREDSRPPEPLLSRPTTTSTDTSERELLLATCEHLPFMRGS